MDEATKYKAYLEGLKKATTKKSKFKSMAEMRAAKGFKPGETVSQFNKRRMMLGIGKQAARATTIGKVALGIGALGLAAKQYLKSKMKKEPEEKMGGGMMKKYKSGSMVHVKTKIGKNKPTKIC
jgi:hypothetical protein